MKALREPDTKPKSQHPIHMLDPSLNEFNLQPEISPFSPRESCDLCVRLREQGVLSHQKPLGIDC